MDKVVSFTQLQGFWEEVRNLQQGFVTNLYWNNDKHAHWIEDGSLFYKKTENCYILLHQNEGFNNLFYIATCMDAAINVLASMNFGKDHVIDIVSKNEEKETINALIAIGFMPYKRLIRMSHIGFLANQWELSEDISYAHEEDILPVYDALQKGFDHLSEQLPTLQDIKEFVDRNQILVAKDHGRLCGFLIFEIAGKTTWYLRYWYIDPEYRNIGIGAKLIKSSLVIGKDTKRQQLWVTSDNENAIKRYEHYGFSKEKIYNYVFLKNRI